MRRKEGKKRKGCKIALALLMVFVLGFGIFLLPAAFSSRSESRLFVKDIKAIRKLILGTDKAYAAENDSYQIPEDFTTLYNALSPLKTSRDNSSYAFLALKNHLTDEFYLDFHQAHLTAVGNDSINNIYKYERKLPFTESTMKMYVRARKEGNTNVLEGVEYDPFNPNLFSGWTKITFEITGDEYCYSILSIYTIEDRGVLSYDYSYQYSSSLKGITFSIDVRTTDFIKPTLDKISLMRIHMANFESKKVLSLTTDDYPYENNETNKTRIHSLVLNYLEAHFENLDEGKDSFMEGISSSKDVGASAQLWFVLTMIPFWAS